MARNATSAAALFTGKAAIALVASIIFTRSLGPAGRGEIIFILSTAGMLSLLAGAGTGSALLRLRQAGGYTAGKLYTAAVVATAINSLVVMSIFGACWAVWRESAFRGVGPGMALVVALLVGPLLLHQNLTQVSGLDNRLARTTVASLLGSSLYLAVIVAAAWTGRLTEEWVVAAFALGAVLSPVLLVWPFRVVRLRLDGAGPVVRALLRGSWTANVAAVSVLLVWRVDVLLVKVLGGYADLGRYSAATSIAEIALVLVVSLRTALLPQHGADRGGAELATTVARTVRTALAAGAAASLAIAAFGRPLLIVLYGNEFADAWVALGVLVPGVVLLGLQYPLFDALYAAGQGRRLTMIGAGALAFQVVADIVLVPGGGYVAAAMVSAVTYALLFLACAHLFARHHGVPLAHVLLVRAADVRGLVGTLRSSRRRFRPHR